MAGEDLPREDKLRLCPSCRMEISSLAVKCRYCGEEVGKPKLEQRTLSIDDLGGESVYHRAPAGSVIEALEAFRVEAGLEMGDGAQAPDASANAGGSGIGVGPDGMPVLDEDPLGEQSGSGWNSSITSVHKRRPPTVQERIRTVGLVVGVIAVLAFCGVKAPGWIEAYRSSHADAAPLPFVNKAPGILERGGPPLEALRAAAEAIRFENSAQHKSSRDKALERLIEQVEGLLNAKPFNQDNLTRASGLMAKAVSIHPSSKAIAAAEEVNSDNAVYKMSLIGVDGEVATFMSNDSQLMDVEEGDVLAKRFRVRLVDPRSVTLDDTLRGNRTVRFKVGGGPVSR